MSGEEEYEWGGYDVSPDVMMTYDSIVTLQEKGLISAADAAKWILKINQAFVHVGHVAQWTSIKIGKNNAGNA